MGQSVLSRLEGVNKVKTLLKAYAAFVIIQMSVKGFLFLRMMIRFKRATKNLPGKPTDWSGKEVAKNFNHFFDFSANEVLPYGDADLVKWQMPGFEVVFNSPKAIKFMLKDEFANATKPGPDDRLFGLMRKFIGHSIFVLRHGDMHPDEHDRWYRQRKAAALIFTRAKFSNMMFAVFQRHAKSMVEALRPIAEKNSAQNTCDKTKGATPIDMQKEFFTFTFESIQEILFGDEEASKEDCEAVSIAFDGAHRSMLQFYWGETPALLAIACLPFPFGPLFYDFSTSLCMKLLQKRSKEYQSFERHISDLHRMTYEKVARLRAVTDRENREDLISNILKSDTRFSKDPSKAVSWTDEELVAIVLNFVIAGRDTTACTLTWLFYELSINPQVQQKLLEELDTLNGQSPTYEEVVYNLPYLNGCLYEAMRLHPAVPQNVKIAQKDLCFPDGTEFPAGTRFVYSPYAMGRNPAYYPHPMKFDPERWIPFVEPDAFAFPVFQAANRSCLGKDMAKFEAKLLAATLLQNFSFTLESNEDPNVICPTIGLTMGLCNSSDQSAHNLWLVPKARSDIVVPKTSAS